MEEQLQLDDEDIPIALRRAWSRTLRQLASRVSTLVWETHLAPLVPMTLAEETTEAGRTVVVVTMGAVSAFNREWVMQRHQALIQGLLEEVMDADVRLLFVIAPHNRRQSVRGNGGNGSSGNGNGGDNGVGSGNSTGRGRIASGSGNANRRTPVRADGEGAGNAEEGGDTDNTDDTDKVPPTRLPPQLSPVPMNERGRKPFADGTPLMGEYTFDTFVVGKSNRMAHAGAHAVSQAPGKAYNPLFLYGPPGLGKTHLMHAIGNAVQNKRVAYTSGESFTTHFITSLREHKAEEFRRKWRSVDIWLVDDVQFIAGKESTKEEFFHTFNALYQTGKQIVLTSDRSPRDLEMEERLRSRFECGLAVDIAPPDLETRMAILQNKLESDHEGAAISDDVLLYMAKLVQSNIRTLEGALTKLLAYASLTNSPVTRELAAGILERYYITPTASGLEKGRTHPAGLDAAMRAMGGHALTPEMVQRVVAARLDIPLEVIVGPRRDRDAVRARQIAMHLLRELTQMSLPGIGQLFGGRDHSTVKHSCDRIREMMPHDDDLRGLVEDLIRELNEG